MRVSYKVSEVGPGGQPGSDGSESAWCYVVTKDGVMDHEVYVYPVYMPERFSDWRERGVENDWDIECMTIDADDNYEYEWRSNRGFDTFTQAYMAARSEAEAGADLARYLIEMEVRK